jgi:hypothetical protein
VIFVATLGLSPLFVPISLWWAAGIQVFPLQLGMGLGVLFVARFAIHRRRRELVYLAVSYAGALLFWQKALLIAVPVGFVAVMLAQGPFRERVRLVRATVVALAVPVVLYLPIYLALTREGDAAKTSLFQRRGLGDSLMFYFTGIVEVGLPALVGGPWAQISTPQDLVSMGVDSVNLVLLVVVVALGVLALALRRNAWIPLASVAFYALVSWGLLLTSSRYEVMGNLSVRDARYAADILPVALLALMFLISPTRLERSGEGWMRRSPTFGTGKHLQVASAAAALGITVSAVVGNSIAWQSAAPHSPKPWVDNLLVDARAVGNGTLYDSMAPPHVILSAFFWGDGRISKLLKPLGLPLAYDTPTGTLGVVDDNGHIREVEIESASESRPESAVPGCGYLVKPGELTVIPLTAGLYDWQWGIHLDYFSEAGGTLVLNSASESATIPLTEGLSHAQLVVEDEIRRFAVSSLPDSGPICITQVRIGALKASDRPLRRT